MKAENRMGQAEWSLPSRLIETEYGEPDEAERTFIADVTRKSVVLCWFTPNPYIYKASPTKFKIECNGEGKDWCGFPSKVVELKECMTHGKGIGQ